MNQTDMLDSALGQLDPATQARLDASAALDPALSRSLDRLHLAVHRLLDDGDEIAIPDGLAKRAVAKVEAARARKRTLLDYVPASVPFRWADIAVAAGIFLAGLLTLVPAVRRTRDQMNMAGCTLNLRQIGVALSQYANQHHAYPYVAPGGLGAGTFAVVLHDSGLLPDHETLHCPCNGPCSGHPPLPSLEDVRAANAKARDSRPYARLLNLDYAYNLGRTTADGPGPLPANLPEPIPILADQPPHDGKSTILPGNSPNHSGRGQNVLYSDGRIRWHRTRWVAPADPDMYLNGAGLSAAGLTPQDSVLAPSWVPFRGR